MRRATIVVYLALAAVAAIAAAAARDDGPARNPVVTEAGGSFSLANSREGMPVFTAANIGPGDSARGTVEIANEGSDAIAVTLSQRNLADVPGTGGSVLSDHLWLKIADGAAIVFTGPLAALRSLPLGTLAPGASRHYEFVATFPNDGMANAATENSVQGSSTSVTYSWIASEAPSARGAPSAPTNSSPSTTGSPSPAAPLAQPPRLGVRIVGYRNTLRNGRLIAWVRCNQACRVSSGARLLGVGRGGRLRPTARHAQRRRFGARTRRLALPVPEGLRQPLATAKAPKVRIVVVARNRAGESAKASKLLRLSSPAAER